MKSQKLVHYSSILLRSLRMTGREDRDLRKAAAQCMESEYRVKLLEGLYKKGLGLRSVEEFVCKELGKQKRREGIKNRKVKTNNNFKLLINQKFCPRINQKRFNKILGFN